MKKIVLLLIGLLFLSWWVSAYQVTIDAPDSLAVGKPLFVTGTTTFGIGTPVDVVLYYQLTTTTEIQRKIAYIQPDKSFKTVFDTTGLKPGTYKVEVPANGFGDSVTMRLVTLYDRSGDIYLSSPHNQSFSGRISLSGRIKGDENSGVQIEVVDPDGLVVFGPQYVNTDNAANFAAEIPITVPGVYEISFTDVNGYIGSRTITSLSPATVFPPVTPVGTVTANPIVVSAHAPSSRDNPAYFIVKTGTGPVTLYTSKSPDWVIEYTDDKGVLHMENDQGQMNPETAEFQGNGKIVYVKIYPYKYSVTSDVFLYGENVRSIEISPTVPAPFTATEPQVATTEQSPVVPVLGVIALGTALVLRKKKE